MTDAIVQLPVDSTGKKVDTTELTVGANTVERQRVQVAGAGAAELADVRNATPGAADYGSVVRTPQLPPALTASSALPVNLVDAVGIALTFLQENGSYVLPVADKRTQNKLDKMLLLLTDIRNALVKSNLTTSPLGESRPMKTRK